MSEYDDTWHVWLSERRARLLSGATKLVGQNIQLVDQNGFADDFVRLCDDNGEYDEQRMLSGIYKECRSVIEFSHEIDSNRSHAPPNNLTGLFYTTVLLAVQVVTVHRGEKIETLLYCVHELARGFPNFLGQAASYPTHAKVQQPLRQMFALFLDCVGEMMAGYGQLKPGETYPSQRVRDLIGSTKTQYLNLKHDWDMRTRIAKSAEQAHGTGWRGMSDPGTRPHNTLNDSFPIDNDAKQMKPLGKPGRYGQVFLVKDKAGYEMALKLVRYHGPSHTYATLETRVREEYEIMCRLQHYHIANVKAFDKDSIGLYIMMHPVADCDLSVFLREADMGSTPEPSHRDTVATWFGCLISAVCFAHNLNIIHQDIKPQNILVKDSRIYLSDFGSARKLEPLELTTASDYLFRGTALYMAPEVSGSGKRAKPEDIFSLGCVFSEMLTYVDGKSLVDFRTLVLGGDKDPQFCFKDRLEDVEQWLRNLRCPEESSAMREVWVATREMLQKKPSLRPVAGKLKEKFLREQHLFCGQACAE